MKRFLFVLLAAWAGSGLALAQDASTPPSDAAPAAAPAIPPVTETPLTPAAATPLQEQVVTPVEAPVAAPAEPQADVVAPAPVAAPPAPPVARASEPPPPLVPAGRWDGDFNASATLSEGSTKSMSLQMGLDAAYRRPDDKLAVSAQYLESRSRSVSNGVVTTSLTALQWRLGGRYDRDINPRDFGFVGLDFSHDEVRQLLLRSEPSTGLGRHMVKTRDDQWDVYAGLTWREDFYYEPGVEIDGQQRARYDTVDTLFGEESTHQLAEQVRFKQKFVLYPGLLSTQGTRALLDAGLQVDLNKTLSLSVKLQGRYDAWAPAEKVDLLLLTGLSVKFRD